MSKAKGYSPRFEPDLIPVLYRERQARKIPMTELASRLIRAALRFEGVLGVTRQPGLLRRREAIHRIRR